VKTRKKLWKRRLDVQGNVRRRLPELAARYIRRGNRAFRKGKEWDDVHKFRIATKRFRYTLELFEGQYGPGLTKRIDELKQLQTLLGDANDCIATAALLNAVPDTADLRTELASKADAKLKKARAWWRSHLGNTDAEHLWLSYLQRAAVDSENGGEQLPARKTSVKVPG
jgi:CHAD domain-containing protein